MLGKPRRLAILAEARFTALDAKTAVGVLRYRPEEVAAVVDSTRAGRTAQACVGVGGDRPVLATLGQAAAAGGGGARRGCPPARPEPWPPVGGAPSRPYPPTSSPGRSSIW